MIAEVSGIGGAGSRIKDWHCAFMGQVEGPYGEEQLRSMIQSGKLTAQTFVWNSSPGNAEKGWVQACDTELASLFMENISLSPPLASWKEPSLRLSASGAPYEETWSAPIPRAAKPMAAKAEDGERIATLKTRFLAFLADFLISSIMALLAMIICGAVFSLVPRVFALLGIYVKWTSSSMYLILTIIASPPIGILIASLINVSLIYRRGQTYGKKILGLRIVSTSGRKLSFFRNIIIRSLVKLAPVVPPLIAIDLHILSYRGNTIIIMMLVIVPLLAAIDLCFLFREDRRALHDIIGGTIVVNSK
jgi:uncharacterized RDD family membrane protein YckC